MVIKLAIFKILPSIITSPKGEIHGLTDRKMVQGERTLDSLTTAITSLFE